MDARATAALALLSGLAVLFLVYAYASRRSHAPLPAGGLLLTLQVGAITGVEREVRMRCPRRARALLVSDGQLRGLMYRSGTEWVVALGPELRVTTPGSMTVHCLSRNAPLTGDAGGVRGSDDIVLPGFTAHRNSAVALAALGGVQRFETQADAVAAAAAPGCLVLHNGPYDPAFYVVRLAVSHTATSALVQAPGLPGTVYVPPAQS